MASVTLTLGQNLRSPHASQYSLQRFDHGPLYSNKPMIIEDHMIFRVLIVQIPYKVSVALEIKPNSLSLSELLCVFRRLAVYGVPRKKGGVLVFSRVAYF